MGYLSTPSLAHFCEETAARFLPNLAQLFPTTPVQSDRKQQLNWKQ
jgi:hypothetical protein